jgi:hypothetical protein
MAILAFTNAKVTVNAVDLSDHCKEVSVEFDAADLDSTVFSSAGWTSHLGGLKSGKVDITFNQDYAASKVDATLWAALGTSVAITVKAVNTTTSATNPEYQFNALVNQVPGPSGKVGDILEAKISWPIDGAVTRAVA